MSPDRRLDPITRRRITQLEDRYHRTARTLRIAMLALAVGIVGGLYAYGQLLDRVQAGRRVGVAINCGTTNAIITAGRATIAASAVGPKRFVHNLERLGYPPPKVRTKAARVAADAYERSITAAVARQSHLDAHKIVRADGTLRCAALQGLAKTK